MSTRHMFDSPEIDGLAQLIECHFHEDWQTDYRTTKEAVAHFIALGPDWVVRNASERLDGLLSRAADAELERLVKELGSAVSTRALGLTTREWLTAISAQLRGHVVRNE